MTTYPVTLRIDPADGILLGMSANANILVASKTDALTLPLKALKVDGTRTYVTIVHNNGTRRVSTEDRDVTVGLANGNLVEILSGVTTSDEVQVVDTTSTSLSGLFGAGRNRSTTPTAGAGG